MSAESLKEIIDESIKKMLSEEQEYLQKAKEIKIKICALNELKNEVDKKIENNIKENIKDSPTINKTMDENDIKKINLFLEYLDKVGKEDITWKLIKLKMPKIEYYIYNKQKRLWSSMKDFQDDFNLWLNRKGHWTNAFPKPDNRPDDLNYPVIEFNQNSN